VKQVGEHYIATGENADLWLGELVKPISSKTTKIFQSSEMRSQVAIKIIRPRGKQSSGCREKLEEVHLPISHEDM